MRLQLHPPAVPAVDIVLVVPDVVDSSLQGLNELELVRNAEVKLKDAGSSFEVDRR